MSDCHIDIQLETSPLPYILSPDAIQTVASQLLSFLGLDGYELSLRFVSQEEIQALNAQYRSLDKPTDVLSFPQEEWHAPLLILEEESGKKRYKKKPIFPALLGDIVISLDEAEKNAHDIGHSLDREVCFLLIHGLLHLCGHDHLVADEEALMIEQQQKLLARLQDQGACPWKDMVTKK